MSALNFRDRLVEILTVWSSSRTDFRLYIENGPNVDMETDERPVVAVEIGYTKSEQADLHAQPMTYDEGIILITVLVKELTGMRTGYALRQEVSQLLQRRNIAGAVLQTASKVPNTEEVRGWIGYRVQIPFFQYYLE